MNTKEILKTISAIERTTDILILIPGMAALGYLVAEASQRGAGSIGGFIGTWIGDGFIRFAPEFRKAIVNNEPAEMLKSNYKDTGLGNNRKL